MIRAVTAARTPAPALEENAATAASAPAIASAAAIRRASVDARRGANAPAPRDPATASKHHDSAFFLYLFADFFISLLPIVKMIYYEGTFLFGAMLFAL
ncbi:hypothetical protein J437_LFUL016285 [Ladona fulva]|uniref:Uncharacterized protein n=1 Tax=Ladona fulva TaxID=123851 RepID=A0A8K0KKX9_LADFU|nr:hypothetical protein J437_LFUL016285 [Ladona fulva]